MARDKTDKNPAATTATWDEAWTVRDAYYKANPAGYLPGDGASIAEYVRRYLETREPAHLDRALEFCDFRELPVLPELLHFIVRGIRQRRNDGQANKGPVGADVKARAMEIMANLKARGATLKQASEMASAWTQRTTSPRKASSLEKDYGSEGANLERQIREDLDLREGDGAELLDVYVKELDDYDEAIRDFPGLSNELRGRRR
jgi:hypothetical protein